MARRRPVSVRRRARPATERDPDRHRRPDVRVDAGGSRRDAVAHRAARPSGLDDLLERRGDDAAVLPLAGVDPHGEVRVAHGGRDER